MDDFDFSGRNMGRRNALPPPQLMGLPTAGRAGQPELGAVAVAISGMTFYWVLPLMMGARTKKRRRNRPSRQ